MPRIRQDGYGSGGTVAPPHREHPFLPPPSSALSPPLLTRHCVPHDMGSLPYLGCGGSSFHSPAAAATAHRRLPSTHSLLRHASWRVRAPTRSVTLECSAGWCRSSASGRPVSGFERGLRVGNGGGEPRDGKLQPGRLHRLPADCRWPVERCCCTLLGSGMLLICGPVAVVELRQWQAALHVLQSRRDAAAPPRSAPHKTDLQGSCLCHPAD